MRTERREVNGGSCKVTEMEKNATKNQGHDVEKKNTAKIGVQAGTGEKSCYREQKREEFLKTPPTHPNQSNSQNTMHKSRNTNKASEET